MLLLLTAIIDERRDEMEQIHVGTTLDLTVLSRAAKSP